MTFPRLHMYGWSHTCSTLQTYKQHIRYVRRYSIKHFKHHHHYFQVIFNPRRACARVTVLVLSVCLCVCVSVHRRRTRGFRGGNGPPLFGQQRWACRGQWYAICWRSRPSRRVSSAGASDRTHARSVGARAVTTPQYC